MTVWRGTSLSPDDDCASWELWEVFCGEALNLLEVSVGSELSSSFISGVSVKESTNNGVNGIGDSGVASSNGAILSGNLLLLLSEFGSLGGSRRDTAEVLESNSLVDCVWRATKVLESGFVIQRLDHKTVLDQSKLIRIDSVVNFVLVWVLNSHEVDNADVLVVEWNLLELDV